LPDSSMGAYALARLLTSGFVKIAVAVCRPLGQLAAFIQQRICHVYRRQRTASLPSRPAKSRH
jgi:hypothetical protein